jgi:ankyrin repeat protein
MSFKPGVITAVLSVVLASNIVAADSNTLNLSLRQAAISGGVASVEEWVRRGAQVNSRAPHGESALEYSIRFNRLGVALKLVELGANPNLEDDSGLTPLLRAAAECNASRVVEVLLKAGAQVNHRDVYGRTALMNAAHADCVRTVAVLLLHDLHAKDKIEIDAVNVELQSAESLSRGGLVSEMLDSARNYQREGNGDWLSLARKLR